MPRPLPSQFTDTQKFFEASDLWHTKLHGFAMMVGARVLEQYDVEDGSDLCYNLMDQGTIPEDATVDEAARIVAMHILQA
jgi:hypothetical protein